MSRRPFSPSSRMSAPKSATTSCASPSSMTTFPSCSTAKTRFGSVGATATSVSGPRPDASCVNASFCGAAPAPAAATRSAGRRRAMRRTGRGSSRPSRDRLSASPCGRGGGPRARTGDDEVAEVRAAIRDDERDRPDGNGLRRDGAAAATDGHLHRRPGRSIPSGCRHEGGQDCRSSGPRADSAYGWSEVVSTTSKSDARDAADRVQRVVRPVRVGRAADVPVRPVVGEDHPVRLQRLEHDARLPREAGDVDARLQPDAQAHRRQRRVVRRRRVVPCWIDVRASRSLGREPERVVDDAARDLVVAREPGEDRQAGRVGRRPARPGAAGSSAGSRSRPEPAFQPPLEVG